MGRRTARAAFAAQPCLHPLSAPVTRQLPTRVGPVELSGARPVDSDAILGDLGLAAGAALDTSRLRDGLLTLGGLERYRAFWLAPTGTGPDVAIHLDAEPAPQRTFGAGVAFDQFMSGRLWIGGVDRSLVHGDAEGVLLSRLGSYEQDISAFMRRRARVGSAYVPFTVGATLSHESVRLFSGAGELASADTRQAAAFVGLHEDPAASRWRYDVGLDLRLWREPGRETRGAAGIRAALFRARSEDEMATIFETIALNDYQRARLDASGSWQLGGVEARLRVRAGWGNRLPLAQTFTLGGDDGFAGLRIEELRGSQEAFASVLLRRHLTRILRLRVEPMAGAVGNGNGVLAPQAGTYYGKLYAGARAGLEAETLLGPIRVEEGFSSRGTRSLLVRVGYWF